MSIRRSARRTSKKLKRWDIADRRSNAGNAGLEGDKARWFRHRDRKHIDPPCNGICCVPGCEDLNAW